MMDCGRSAACVDTNARNFCKNNGNAKPEQHTGIQAEVRKSKLDYSNSMSPMTKRISRTSSADYEFAETGNAALSVVEVVDSCRTAQPPLFDREPSAATSTTKLPHGSEKQFNR
ncbi:unnamed protein product [Ceratitis capitata]|uniref:(Mediterranean fruit fly) hypothetical protein n=1 Tax=Ceratitis capitata TaxID=7213 RepID=A0A811UGT0_CERCA|nr:unnamed protein product [Ceratitis capitata]